MEWQLAAIGEKLMATGVSLLTTDDRNFAPWAFPESLHTRPGVFSVFFFDSSFF
jgi:hypothetical protein